MNLREWVALDARHCSARTLCIAINGLTAAVQDLERADSVSVVSMRLAMLKAVEAVTCCDEGAYLSQPNQIRPFLLAMLEATKLALASCQAELDAM